MFPPPIYPFVPVFPFASHSSPILVDAPLIPSALCQLSAQAPAAASVRFRRTFGRCCSATPSGDRAVFDPLFASIRKNLGTRNKIMRICLGILPHIFRQNHCQIATLLHFVWFNPRMPNCIVHGLRGDLLCGLFDGHVKMSLLLAGFVLVGHKRPPLVYGSAWLQF